MTALVSAAFRPDDREPRRLRRLVQRVLPPLQDDVVEDVLLCVSELVTNALLYGRPPFHLFVELQDEHLVIIVEDCDEAPPTPVAAAGEHGGFGLHVVAMTAATWGVRPLVRGKAVWAQITRTS
jgi:hypothetical protein